MFGRAHMARRAANREMITHLSGRINAIFDSGVPFFTKDAIRDIAQQINHLTSDLKLGDKASLTFTVRGLDGVRVNITVELGTVEDWREQPDLDVVP